MTKRIITYDLQKVSNFSHYVRSILIHYGPPTLPSHRLANNYPLNAQVNQFLGAFIHSRTCKQRPGRSRVVQIITTNTKSTTFYTCEENNSPSMISVEGSPTIQTFLKINQKI